MNEDFAYARNTESGCKLAFFSSCSYVDLLALKTPRKPLSWTL